MPSKPPATDSQILPASNASLDEIDRALIAALRVNGRAPIADLARSIGVTRATVTKRIERLEERGIILGFTVRLAHDADSGAVRAICHLAIEGRNMNSALHALRGMPAVTALHSTNGEWDLIAELTVPSLAEIDVALSRIREIEGIHRSETSLLLRSVLM